MDRLDTVDIVRGGHAGIYGRCFVYCPDAKIGAAYSDPDDTDTQIALLLDRAEMVLGKPLVVGTVTQVVEVQEQAQGEMVNDDARIELPPKPKKKRKSKPQTIWRKL